MKRILFLGASYFQLRPIRYAKAQGHYVITCDNVPGNPGHALADEHHIVSTTDMMGVLRLARDLEINGIVAYASDPAAPTAAYVAEHMRLPGNPYKSVLTMTHKDLWREWQKKEFFSHPKVYTKTTDILKFPVVVKPVDSSGSKGVTILRSIKGLNDAIQEAIKYSIRKEVIFEEYIPLDGYQIAGDGFVVDGKLVFTAFMNEHFENGGVVPVGESFPYVGSKALQKKVHQEIQQAIDILEYRNGALNFDIRVLDGKVYLMEIGPRAGGNLITDVIHEATGVDLAEYVVKAALGEDCSDLRQVEPKGYYASYMIHADKDGVYEGVEFENLDVIKMDMFVGPGTKVQAFTGSHCTIGTMILKSCNRGDLLHKLDNMEKFLKVNVQ